MSDAKLQRISDMLNDHMKQLAREDQQRWLGLSRDQQMQEGAAAAMKTLAEEAARKVENAAKQALANAAAEDYVKAQMAATKGTTRSQGYVRFLESVHGSAVGIRNMAINMLKDLLDAASSTDGVGLGRSLAMKMFSLDNPAMTRDIVREVFRLADGHTGNAEAKAAARAWLDTIEALRQRFNAAGGAVGKLGYGYLSQAHDAFKVAKAGADKWAADVLPRLDRRQYLNPDGTPMTDPQMIDLLKAAHETISQEGRNKVEPGQFTGEGARSNRGSAHRVLHFRDGDAWMGYMAEYGEGSLYDAMIGHVSRMSRDIALIERMGPNPAATHRLQNDLALRADGDGTMANRSAGNTPEAYWNIVSGATGSPQNRAIATALQNARNVQTFSKITWGPLSALADIGTILQSLHYNKIPVFDYVLSYARQTTKRGRSNLVAHEIIAESLTSTLNRWTGDNMTHSLTGQVANSVMKLSLMNAWTDAARGAFSDVLMHNWSKKIGKDWLQLSEWDRYRLQRAGISEADWGVIQQAKIDPNGTPFLSAPAIRASGHADAAAVAAKWTGYITDESEFAVVNPDLATRAITTGGGMQAGTIRGETMRSVMQFKAFPIAMLTRHWRRVFETPQGLEGAPAGFGASTRAGGTVNRIAVLAALGVTTTLLGALQTQLRQVVLGKDPIDMTGEHAGKFWLKAFSAGGGAGFLGDVLLAPTDSSHGGKFSDALGTLGPIAGNFGSVIDSFQRGRKGQSPGEAINTKLGGVVQTVSNNLPGLWYTRPMYEHWFLHNAQENLNPGYLSRMQRKAQREWGQSYYWRPGEAAPDRAPDIGKAVGQ